jgi:hypothetical protein
MGVIVLALVVGGFRQGFAITWWVILLSAGALLAGTYSGGRRRPLRVMQPVAERHRRVGDRLGVAEAGTDGAGAAPAGRPRAEPASAARPA